jgi:hypothetical protein
LGSKYNSKRTKHFREKLGKVEAPLNEKLKNVEWGEYRIEDVLQWQPQKEIDPLKLEELKDESEPFYPFYGQATIDNGIISYNQLTKAVLNNSDGKPTILIHSNNQNIVYLETPFYLKDGHGATSVLQCEKLNRINQMFIIASIDKVIKRKYSYNNKATKIELKNTVISLPVKDGNVDFDFMESFILELEKERIDVFEKSLSATGLKDYTINAKEQQAIDEYKNLTWKVFNLEELFGKSTRGKRLKSEDRILGALPFVTAGETDEGVSDFIGNNVNVFSANTTTIDMFGSAKYRNYKYGGDDHIAVVHTDKLPKYASIFVTSAIHKSSYNGQFNYGRNFYAKDADVLDISLPVKDDKPDYETMETIISAIHKLVIKDVVLYVQQKKQEEKILMKQ